MVLSSSAATPSPAGAAVLSAPVPTQLTAGDQKSGPPAGGGGGGGAVLTNTAQPQPLPATAITIRDDQKAGAGGAAGPTTQPA